MFSGAHAPRVHFSAPSPNALRAIGPRTYVCTTNFATAKTRSGSARPTAVSFGSDAHQPSRVGEHFDVAVDVAEAAGFKPGRDRHDFWRR